MIFWIYSNAIQIFFKDLDLKNENHELIYGFDEFMK